MRRPGTKRSAPHPPAGSGRPSAGAAAVRPPPGGRRFSSCSSLVSPVVLHRNPQDSSLFQPRSSGQRDRRAVGGHWSSRRQGRLLKDTGPHALRHACASLLIAAGESVKVVSERLGHTDAAMTLNAYSLSSLSRRNGPGRRRTGRSVL
ncbi:tyrosine-type recombinase/integrase [Streptomyces sp. NPDC002088]|uniref:tyrosine-type recombinase/integrase n=1 Tax=Streptomyces sp. NPDC002088 TaxID=3154665 RepID=UPI00331AC54C